MKIPESFYQHSNVTHIAKNLLGKYLFTKINGAITSGMIVETEAYSHREKGCHAYKGMTPRNEVMYQSGGPAYVYLCYGIHNMFNVVTNEKNVADAVLVRALEPGVGIELMQKRMNVATPKRITSGPGKLTKALGVDRTFNGKLLWDDDIWLEEGIVIPRSKIIVSPRIGIDYAGEDALLPWRYTIKDNPWVSKP